MGEVTCINCGERIPVQATTYVYRLGNKIVVEIHVKQKIRPPPIVL